MKIQQTSELPTLVLAVDDEPVNLEVIAAALRPEGFSVVGAHSAEEAMELMRTERPDVVLLDVMMPGENGIELCKRMRADAELVSVPVIFVTALDAASNRRVSLEAGADDYIEKPVNVDRVADRVRSVIAGAGAHTRPATPRTRPEWIEAAELAMRAGFDPVRARTIGLACMLLDAAEESAGGESAGRVATAMATAAGMEDAALLLGRLFDPLAPSRVCGDREGRNR